MSSPPVPRILPPLPAGFVFCPTDQEMVGLLKSRVALLTDDAGDTEIPGFRPPGSLDIWLCGPEDLPSYKEMYGHHVSFFYTSMAKGVCHGVEPTRLAKQGLWKCTGKDTPIKERADGGLTIGYKKKRGDKKKRADLIIGYKKKFTYYESKEPREREISWMMEEVWLNPHLPDHKDLDEEKLRSMAMCKVYNFLVAQKWEDVETTSDFEEGAAGTLGRELGSSSQNPT